MRLLFELFYDEQGAETARSMMTESDALSGSQTLDLSTTGLSFCCHQFNKHPHLQFVVIAKC